MVNSLYHIYLGSNINTVHYGEQSISYTVHYGEQSIGSNINTVHYGEQSISYLKVVTSIQCTMVNSLYHI